MNKINKIICAVILLFSSCRNTVHTIEAKKIKDDVPREESFESFLLRFREDAKNGNTQGVKCLTRFPLKTRGSFDNMPYRYVVVDDFDKFYGYFSREFAGGKYYTSLPAPLLEDTNLYELLHADVSKDVGGSLDDAERYLGNWEFKKINGRWYFAFAYTDYFERNYNR